MQAHRADLFLYVAGTLATSIVRAVVKSRALSSSCWKALIALYTNATPFTPQNSQRRSRTHHAIENVAGRQVSVLRNDARDQEIILVAVSAPRNPVRLVEAHRLAAGPES
ncbi:MAG: hypothetical protein KGK01_18410 [Bradyrhizobium sp.]|uniref:hypothetical protein n=1 Tax=Bradyrhizobium sp. TaxID=376 RepID=UPI001C289738|nr:hypothetical protein [Bradyrhizobium sp.]MBU6463560.1 hypothetical protein [Pseudomonadota bacterium]MDE2068781.1 hypothetical protein [Bradyrhizobium sp.]MDE2244322.1 hypothetical protein [Bradyrhizobium sp.]